MPIIATQASGARNATAPAPATSKTTAMTIIAPQNHIMRECLIIIVKSSVSPTNGPKHV